MTDEVKVTIWVQPGLINLIAEGKNPKIWSTIPADSLIETQIPISLYNRWCNEIGTNGKQLLHD